MRIERKGLTRLRGDWLAFFNEIGSIMTGQFDSNRYSLSKRPYRYKS